MNNKDVVDIEKYSGVVYISVSAKFGLDPHVWVIWAQVVIHVSHTAIHVFAKIPSSTIQAIESTNYGGFLTIISTPFISKDAPDLFDNGFSHVGIHNIT